MLPAVSGSREAAGAGDEAFTGLEDAAGLDAVRVSGRGGGVFTATGTAAVDRGGCGARATGFGSAVRS
ncbi:MAG: hypothetical protein K9M82_09585, partial [Deltaproteobacteria bacterium]|nr:hypothetical protein [Deltaproteobacteria bacterium]